MKGAAATRRAPRRGSLCAVTCAMFAAGSAMLAAGCGQKGPLYLPERTGTVITRPAPASSAQSPSSSSSSSSSTAPQGK